MKTLVYVAGITLLFNNCSKPTEACFTYAPETVKPGENVTFNASCSSNASLFTWNFGDGTIDTIMADKTTSHKYASNGIYRVKLIVKRKDGVSIRKDKPEMTINVTVQ